MAQISKAPTAHKSSYWEDVARTEQWLGSLDKHVTRRALWLHARTVDHLRPWLELQRHPLILEGWLLPMEVGATWRYLHDFLSGQGPDEMGIPCGGDSLVVWRPGYIALRAPRDSWVWVALDHAWPAAGPCLDALAWHQDTRTHQGRRYAWGHVEQQMMANGWEERTVRAERGGEGSVENIWQHLLTRLGTRAVRIQWRQELPGPSVRLLGLPVRLSRADLRVEADTPWDSRIARTWPEPTGLKVRAEWEVPRWNAHWATRIRLRRWKDGSRLEAVYVTEAHGAPVEAQRLLCQERRRLPIFTLETVHPSHPGRRWADLERRASEAGRLAAVARATRLVAWPRAAAVQYPRRLRPRWPGWRVSRLESTAGRWTWVHLPTDIRITIDLPQPGSPGNLNVALPGAAGLTMRDLDPEVKIDRFHSDWRYWVYLALEYLMPTVSRHAPTPEV